MSYRQVYNKFGNGLMRAGGYIMFSVVWIPWKLVRLVWAAGRFLVKRRQSRSSAAGVGPGVCPGKPVDAQ